MVPHLWWQFPVYFQSIWISFIFVPALLLKKTKNNNNNNNLKFYVLCGGNLEWLCRSPPLWELSVAGSCASPPFADMLASCTAHLGAWLPPCRHCTSSPRPRLYFKCHFLAGAAVLVLCQSWAVLSPAPSTGRSEAEREQSIAQSIALTRSTCWQSN